MNREEMHQKLEKLNPLEETLKMLYLEKERDSQTDACDPAALRFIAKEIQNSMNHETHMSQEQYRLDERKNIELVKHMRYTTSYMHDHDFFEMAFAYQGSCSHTFLIDGKRMESTLEECDLVIIPPGLKHEIGIYSDSVMVNILINSNTFRQVFFSKLPANNLLYDYFMQVLFSEKQQSFLLFRTEGDKKLKNIVLDMYMERMEADNYSNTVCDYLLNIFFLQVLRHPQSGIRTANSGGNGKSLIASLLWYLDTHYAKTSLSQLAELYHFTPTYLNRVFKKYTNSTVLQYIRHLRMAEARRLLLETGLSMEQIARETGYQDVPYFIETFRKETGETPLQYRKNHKG